MLDAAGQNEVVAEADALATQLPETALHPPSAAVPPADQAGARLTGVATAIGGGCAAGVPVTVEREALIRRGADQWIADAAGRWWVLHTRARSEKRVAEILEEHQVCCYLPLISVHRTYVKSKFTFRIPLFPGYVFLCGDHGDCEKARRTNRVANIIYVANQDELRAELSNIYRVVESDQTIDLFPALQVGQRCRIVTGALKGIEGVVIRRGRRCRLYLAVSTLGQSAVVEVDAALLEAVN